MNLIIWSDGKFLGLLEYAIGLKKYIFIMRIYLTHEQKLVFFRKDVLFENVLICRVAFRHERLAYFSPFKWRLMMFDS